MSNNYMTPSWVADLQRSNREVEQEFKTMDKVASKNLSDHFNTFGANEPIEKIAFEDNMYDMMMTTKRLVQKQLSITDGPAHDIASKVITKATEIHDQYGGNLNVIIHGIVSKMDATPAMPDSSPQIHVKALKQGARADDLEAVEMRVMSEFGMDRQNTDRYVRTLLNEASDLRVTYKGFDKYEMANAILDVVISFGNPELVYNFKSSKYACKQLEELLGVE